MAATQTEESMDSTFWTVESGSEEDYWTAYESMRPKYGDYNFLENAYDYHAAKSGLFDVAHDVACGYGKATVEIAKRFKQVIASDSNASSIHGLRQRCAPSMSNIAYEVTTVEDLAQHFAESSADFIAVAQAFPILDPALALSSIAHVLKPNGTMAAWFYGRAFFTEDEYRVKCQPLFDTILGKTFGKVTRTSNSEVKATWKKAAVAMASWLDNVDFSTGQWTKVQRRKWNSKSAKMSFSPGVVDSPPEPISNVKDNEEVIEIEDPMVWARSWNIDGVRKYINYSFPGVRPAVEADQEIQHLFSELAEAMGGGHAVRAVSWPIVLLLATRSV